jgi:hypothetical protein
MVVERIISEDTVRELDQRLAIVNAILDQEQIRLGLKLVPKDGTDGLSKFVIVNVDERSRSRRGSNAELQAGNVESSNCQRNLLKTQSPSNHHTDKMSNSIVNTTDLDNIIKKGKDSQKAREAAMKEREADEAEKRRQEEMKKLAEDAGRVSQEKRGKDV